MDVTPEGFLICRGAPINRIGDQQYLARELQLDGDPERVVTVHRHPEDVFSPAALASFEGKDVTQGHPPESVTPENHSFYSKGHCENVRRSGNFTLADLIIKDALLISDIRNGVVREISCGYNCQYVPDGNGYRQVNIQGNHVAVVLRGRAGREVAIKDAAREGAGKGRKYMGKFTNAILTALGMAAREAESPDEIPDLVKTAATALDAAPEEKEGEPPKKEDDPPAEDAPCKDEMVEKAPKGDDLGSKLDRLIEMLSSLEHKSGGEEKKLRDEKDLDAAMAKLGGGKDEAAVIPAGEPKDEAAAAGDAAMELLRRMRPAVASIKDKTERARVVDALLGTLEGREVMDGINQAAQNSARKAADAAKATDYEKICADQQAEYYARNPHKNKEG